MKKSRRHLIGLAALLLAAPLAVASAAEKKGATPKAQAPASATAPAIDPEAITAVDRMQAFLQTLKSYSIHADTTTDEVLLSGPKVQFGGTLDVIVRLPDRLLLTKTRDDKDTQEFFYDGSTLSVWIEDGDLWASALVAPTVGEMVKQVRAKYDLSFPLDDLIRGASRGELLKDVTAGIVIGTGFVGGTLCDHLGFHEEGIDAQLWIEQGDRPLPRKFVITTLGEPSQPQHSEVLTWDLSPKIDEAMFTFNPSANAKKIVFAEPQAPQGAKKDGSR